MDESISLELPTRSEYLVWTETVLLSVINHDQRGCLLWKSFRLLRCAQKPETSLAAQHVCGSASCERYFSLYLLLAFLVATLYHGRWIFGAKI